MEQTNQECESCHEAIKDPICPGCVEKEMETWLNYRKPSMIEKLRKTTYINTGKSGTCILCGDDFGVCDHCYSSEVHDVIEEEGDDWLEEEFITLFDSDVSHAG